ncbi:MAG: hypothetical protein ACXADY_09930 [Candidatus Hodarchaeales archaeon]|jgi:hypothetical protein
MVDQEELHQTTVKDIEQLKKVQLANLELLKTLRELKRKQQVINDQITKGVYTATDEQGNKKFTNETMRKTEVNRQLTESEEYQTREKDIEKIDTDIQRNKIEQEYLRNMIAVNREYMGSK